MLTLQSFIPQSLENRAALRAAFTALISVFLAFLLHMDAPYWAGITAVVVSNIYTGRVITKAALRLIGTFCGAGFGYYIAGVTVNSFYFYLLTCFLIMVVSTYYYNISDNAYAYILGGATAFIVAGQLAIYPSDALTVAIWRFSEVSLGVVVSAITAYSVFPNNITDNFYEHTDILFSLFLEEIDLVQSYLFSSSPLIESLIKVNQQMKAELKKTSEITRFMRHEFGTTKELFDKLNTLLALMYSLARAVNYFISLQKNEPIVLTAGFKQLPIEEVFRAIHQDLNHMKNVFASKKILPYYTLATELAMNDLDAAFMKNKLVPSDHLESYYSVYHLLKQIKEIITHLGMIVLSRQPVNFNNKKSISRMRRLQYDPDVIFHSIKAGLIIVVALLIWLLSNWPGGLAGIVSSIVISIRQNVAEMKHVSWHRMLGCLLGGGASLIMMSLVVMDFFNFSVILFILVWAFAYFSFKFKKYAYVGLQANMALVITLVQGGSPPLYLYPGLERLGGIFIGIIASFMVASVFIQRDRYDMLDKGVRRLSLLLDQNIQQLMIKKNQGQILLQDPTEALWFCYGLVEALNEEKTLGKKQKQFAALITMLEKLVYTQAIIRCIYDAVDRSMALHTAEKLNISLEPIEREIQLSYAGINKKASQSIHECLDNYLALVKTGALEIKCSKIELSNLFVYLRALKQLQPS